MLAATSLQLWELCVVFVGRVVNNSGVYGSVCFFYSCFVRRQADMANVVGYLGGGGPVIFPTSQRLVALLLSIAINGISALCTETRYDSRRFKVFSIVRISYYVGVDQRWVRGFGRLFSDATRQTFCPKATGWFMSRGVFRCGSNPCLLCVFVRKDSNFCRLTRTFLTFIRTWPPT